jgi:outer membrane protein TolC
MALGRVLAVVAPVAGKESLDLKKKNMAAELRKYELGSGTIFLVLEAQTEVAQAKQSLLQAEVGYQLAVTAVEPYHLQIAELTH